jgi:hypothetical protein
MRRAQDSLNPRTHANVMVLSQDDTDAHPYWYARIVGIFHVMAHYSDPYIAGSVDPTPMDFLFVRWYGREPSHNSGWRAKHLPQVGYVDAFDDLAFGFLDPSQIIRASHLIPAYHFGRTDELLAPSIARTKNEQDEDWRYYYVNMYVNLSFFFIGLIYLYLSFVDHDMIMRY